MRQDYDMTFSRKMTVGEVKAATTRRIGKEGESEIVDIFDMEVSNAWYREE